MGGCQCLLIDQRRSWLSFCDRPGNVYCPRKKLFLKSAAFARKGYFVDSRGKFAGGQQADGLIIVAPEYNHSFPGLLKHVLDTNLTEYIHKAVGVCGVSAGPFGGVRMIQSLIPVLRELGLVTIFWDVYFGNAGKLFDPVTGKITDSAYTHRLKKFLDELVWMARALRYARENIPPPQA